MIEILKNPRVLAVISAGAVIAALLIALLQVHEWRENREQRADRDQLLEVATAQVLDLTTMDSDSVADNLKRLSGRTTGDFKQQFREVTKTFRRLVRKQNVSATGAIDAAAVEKSTKDAGTVIVAASAKITNEESADPVLRTYRLRVDLQRTDDEWQVSGMEFVE